MSEGYSSAEGYVQERPAASVAFAFGCGVAVGVGLALLFASRPEPSTWERGRDTAQHYGRRMRDRVAAAIPDRFRG
jgi:hypothetical protein